MKRTSLAFVLLVAGCNPEPAATDGGPVPGTDAPTADAPGSDAPGSDAPGSDAPATADGGSSFDVTAYCERIAACTPGVSVATCAAGVEAEIARVGPLGCGDEGEVANECTARISEPVDGGACMPDYFECDAEYTAFNQCVVTATGVTEFSCDSGYVCVTTEGSAALASSVCPSVIGTVVDACDPADAVGRCVRDVFGGITQTSLYYEPLPDGVTLEVLETACTNASAGVPGVWTAL